MIDLPNNEVNANWSISTNVFGGIVTGIDEINQTIGLILSTKKGTDPFRPTFGSDVWEYIDKPINSAGPNIVRAITDALGRWEKRVKIVSITYVMQSQDLTDPNVPSGLIFTIVWSLTGGTEQELVNLALGVDLEEQIIRILGTQSGDAITTFSNQLILL